MSQRIESYLGAHDISTIDAIIHIRAYTHTHTHSHCNCGNNGIKERGGVRMVYSLLITICWFSKWNPQLTSNMIANIIIILYYHWYVAIQVICRFHCWFVHVLGWYIRIRIMICTPNWQSRKTHCPYLIRLHRSVNVCHIHIHSLCVNGSEW